MILLSDYRRIEFFPIAMASKEDMNSTVTCPYCQKEYTTKEGIKCHKKNKRNNRGITDQVTSDENNLSQKELDAEVVNLKEKYPEISQMALMAQARINLGFAKEDVIDFDKKHKKKQVVEIVKLKEKYPEMSSVARMIQAQVNLGRLEEDGSRKPTAYNKYMKKEIARIKKEQPGIKHQSAFKEAASNWGKAEENPNANKIIKKRKPREPTAYNMYVSEEIPRIRKEYGVDQQSALSWAGYRWKATDSTTSEVHGSNMNPVSTSERIQPIPAPREYTSSTLTQERIQPIPAPRKYTSSTLTQEIIQPIPAPRTYASSTLTQERIQPIPAPRKYTSSTLTQEIIQQSRLRGRTLLPLMFS